MATAQTALQMMRKVCLALPDSAEAEHFGEACFRVNKRIFATCGEKEGVCRLVFQLEPEHARQLVASDPRFKPYTRYTRQKNGVWIDAADVRDWGQVGALVLESYRLSQPGSRPPKKARTPRPKKRARE